MKKSYLSDSRALNVDPHSVTKFYRINFSTLEIEILRDSFSDESSAIKQKWRFMNGSRGVVSFVPPFCLRKCPNELKMLPFCTYSRFLSVC